MATFTVFHSDGTTEEMLSHDGVAAAGSSITLYDEDGTTVLGTIGVQGSTYLKAAPSEWRQKVKAVTDTLVTSDGNDLYVYDAGTTSGVGFDGAGRQQILTSNTNRIVHLVELRGGDDVLNLTRLNGGTTPPPDYNFTMTAWGGDGADWIATGVADDRLHGDAGSDKLWAGGGNDTLYGGTSVDSAYGGSGDDTLFGDAGLDLIFGGNGNDTVVGQVDAVAGGGEFVVGFEGGDHAVPVTVALSAGDQKIMDFIDGGSDDFGTDTLLVQMSAGTPGARNVLMLSGPGAFSPHIFGIEVITASAAVDIINLTWYEGGTNFAYDQNVTVQSGDGNDVVFSGDGDDLLVGDATGGVSGFSDTLFGGRGNDVIFADSDSGGPGGADTVFGGFGNDTIYGGGGDDQLIDFFDGHAYGGLGSDLVAIHFFGGGGGGGIVDGGPDDTTAGTDGNDRVFITGIYDEVTSNLGPGNDLFVSFADEDGESGSGQRKDIVFGGSGSDVISSWYGDDTIDGGTENDALWGGAGGDTIYGGPGTDFLYPGEGDNDQVFGGAGIDFYYWSRFDGQGDQIFDEFRDTGAAGQAINGLVVFAGFGENGVMNADEGVFEIDGTIDEYQPGNYDDPDNPMPSNDMVYVYDLDGAGPETLWRLEIVDETSPSYGNYIDFDQRDISVIALWNHEAGPGEQVITQYVWNGSTYALLT